MNILSTTIHSINNSKQLSYIQTVSDDEIFTLFLVEKLDQKDLIGKKVNLAFKETEVILAKGEMIATTNIKNGKIKQIEKGELLTHVTLSFKEYEIKSLVATPAFESLHVNIGDTLSWLVQPSEISLLWGQNGF
jgi:molybdopterin-binding protein